MKISPEQGEVTLEYTCPHCKSRTQTSADLRFRHTSYGHGGLFDVTEYTLDVQCDLCEKYTEIAQRC